jgi:PhzF family phenazine biosynthesis protein
MPDVVAHSHQAAGDREVPLELQSQPVRSTLRTASPPRVRGVGTYAVAVEILRYTAFSSDPSGGNPAGVVLDAGGATDAEMRAVAADVGFSETAFLFPRGDRAFDVRYFSPLAEVPFCGHATIASGVAYAERHGQGRLTFDTKAGRVDLATAAGPGGLSTATLVSVPPRIVDLADDDRSALLAALRWNESDLDPGLPPRVAYAGAWHPILAAASRERLAALGYDFDALAALMAAGGWTTIDFIWRQSPTVVYAAIRSRPAALSRTRPPVQRPPRSADTCAS